jgi:hypothetical protein
MRRTRIRRKMMTNLNERGAVLTELLITSENTDTYDTRK